MMTLEIVVEIVESRLHSACRRPSLYTPSSHLIFPCMFHMISTIGGNVPVYPFPTPLTQRENSNRGRIVSAWIRLLAATCETCDASTWAASKTRVLLLQCMILDVVNDHDDRSNEDAPVNISRSPNPD